MALSIAAGAVIALLPGQPEWLLLLPVVMFLRMALNAVDGMLAREHNQKSSLGAVLNELGDVVSDAALYLPLALVPGFSPALIVVDRAAGHGQRNDRRGHADPGRLAPLRRPDGQERPGFHVRRAGPAVLGLGVSGGLWLTGVLGIALLLVFTIVNRARQRWPRPS
jgi:CDP-diacylglycerol--glycerol-3-phosphate 3-phosphatidyltransferase